MPITAPPLSALEKITTYLYLSSKYSSTSSTTCEAKGSQRHFCTKCGCHVFRSRPRDFGDANAERDWEVATGVLNDVSNYVFISQHVNVSDTKDGGLSIWITKPNQLPPHVPLAPDLAQPEAANPALLPAHCACTTVAFHLTRPNPRSALPHSPFPDLMIPYRTQDALIANAADEKWWLRGPGGRAVGSEEDLAGCKYLAGTCACRSCRLTSGFDVQTWAFVPRANVFLRVPAARAGGSVLGAGSGGKDGDDASEGDDTVIPLDFTVLRQLESAGQPLLKSYESSPGVIREFCPVCGATVFWHDKWRPEVVDVSVGLLDAKEGARAEEWLEWWRGRVSFAEDAEGRGDLVSTLERGLGVKDATESFRGVVEGLSI
jgi:hypothetical protein